LCLSGQENPQGVPKELLEAKKLELIQEKVIVSALSTLDCLLIILQFSSKLRKLVKPFDANGNKTKPANESWMM
jgi:hypothetical protein